ncbi:MAG: hypothetical protein U0136_11665 [Bdellovibrionota bacterium]
MPHRSLNPEKILSTVRTLRNRVRERFPQAGLVQVADELVAITEEAQELNERLRRRASWMRGLIIFSVLAILVAGFFAAKQLQFAGRELNWTEFAQGIEASINDIVLVGAALFFLFTLDSRFERRAVLQKLHELRSIAHVVDMHQLTKDPERVNPAHNPTPSSPKYTLEPHELTRYLDYCSEMLSLIGKLAALHGKDSSDSVVLNAVDEVESLSTGISRKIWQKIMIILTTQDAATRVG